MPLSLSMGHVIIKILYTIIKTWDEFLTIILPDWGPYLERSPNIPNKPSGAKPPPSKNYFLRNSRLPSPAFMISFM
jgi:hypothetical protein